MFPIADDSVQLNENNENQGELGKSLSFDYETKSFVLIDGSPQTEQTAEEKVKQWLELLCRTVPDKYACHIGTGFGVDTDGIMGTKAPNGFKTSEIQREISESCRLCPAISGVSNFSFKGSGDKFNVSFTVTMAAGGTMEAEVII